jgi:2-amino-4-hydroxy-6-hydroxymethyldihydropteridine diphosphokinase/dihydropteroate synthase
MGKREISPSCAENGRAKRLTPLSDSNTHARRLSCGQGTRLDATMNPVQSSPLPHRAFIALGSNVGDRVEMIEKACLELDRVNIKVKRTSSLFETEPMYVLDQAPFMNGVCEVSF